MSDNIVSIIVRSYHGKNIRVNPITRYVCLTDMASANKKLTSDWIRLKGTHEYLSALSLAMGIPIAVLLHVENGNITWACAKVAIKFASWCCPEFEVQVTSWIDELIETGSVYLAPKTALELAREQVKLHEKLELQAAQIVLLEESNEIQSEMIDELFNYSSIIRVAKFNNCDEKTFKWHNLKAASIVLSLEVKQAPCPRFGSKNLYAHEAWRVAYPDYLVPENMALDIIV